MAHEPVKALSALVVDRAKGTTERLVEAVDSNDLKEC